MEGHRQKDDTESAPRLHEAASREYREDILPGYQGVGILKGLTDYSGSGTALIILLRYLLRRKWHEGHTNIIMPLVLPLFLLTGKKSQLRHLVIFPLIFSIPKNGRFNLFCLRISE